MKRTIRSILSCVLCALILYAGVAPAQVRLPLTVTANAADLTYGDYTYTVSGSNATITKYNGTASTVSIPSKIGSYTVKIIGQEAFRDNKTLISVTIPSTVTAIGNSGYGGDGAFQNCTKLQTVTIVKGTNDAYVGKDAFAGCASLQSITVPGNYTTIRSGAFNGCISLKSATLEKSASSSANQTIEDNAFQGCSSLTELSLPTTLKTIGNSAFAKCTSLKNINIPEGVVTIGAEAFHYDSALLSVSIPSTVTAIGTSGYGGDGAFQECTKLQSVTIAKGTNDAYVGKDAFSGCTSLKSIKIPGNYTTIRSSAFYNCTSLTSVIYEQSDYIYANQTIEDNAFQGCSSLTELSLPTTLKTIGNSAFAKCTSLQNITIPEGVVTIGAEAFRYDSGLNYVSISSTVTTIGTSGYGDDGAFQDCANLQTVIIAHGTKDTTIGKDAFKGCVALTTAHIPSNVASILDGAFTNCGNVTICNTTSDCYAKTYADTNNIPFRICSGHAASIYYTVILTANGGTVSPSSFTVNSGSSFVLPTPTRSGYTCLGWSTNSTASSASYACGTSYKPTSNMTLYAVWQKNSVPVTTYTINLNANGGTVSPSSFTVNSGSSFTLPTPIRSGYTCLGWSTSSSASSASYACGTSYKPTSNMTLYAVWQKNSSVPTGSLSISTDSVTVKENKETTIDLSKTGSNNTVYVSCDNPEVISYVLHDWNGDTSAITVKGLKAGTARLTLTLYDQVSGIILDTKEVSVTVEESQNSDGSSFVDVLLLVLNGIANFFELIMDLVIWLFDWI